MNYTFGKISHMEHSEKCSSPYEVSFFFFSSHTDELYTAQIISNLLLFTTQVASNDVHNRVVAYP